MATTTLSWAQPLNGTYTIGGTTPDYATFNAALTDLETNGVSGPVTFNIRTGTYNEQIRINSFTGASLANMVVFQSETGIPTDVVLHHQHTGTSTNANYTIFIDGADFLTFQNMTIQANPENLNSDDKNRVIYIENNSDNLNFFNNRILSWYTIEDYFEYNECIFVGADYAQSMDNDSISFIGNTIVGGHIGLNFQGSQSAGNFEATGWVVEDNTFTDQGGGAIKVLIGMNTRISGNVIESSRLQSDWNAIEINQCNDSLLIENNTIRMNGAGSGIVLAHLEQSGAAFKQISNNMVTFGPDYQTGTPVAIRTQNTCPTFIAHNSVNMYGSYPSGACLYSYGSDSLMIYNNQLANFGGQPAYIIGGTTGQITSNNNNLYSSGTTLVSHASNNYSSIGSLSGATGWDLNSVNVDPLYFNNNLLIPYATSTYNAGTPVPTVSHDFYGTPRSTATPDIGVFEGLIPTVDAALIGSSLDNYTACPNDTFDLYIRFRNMGSTVLTNLDIYYVNGGTTFGPINWNGSLNQNDIDSVLVTNVTFPQTPQVTFTMYCNNPNGGADQIPQNDTLLYQSLTALNGTYTIGSSGSDYTSFNDAVLDLTVHGVCGPVIFEAESGSYNEQFIIPDITGASATNTITFRSASLDSSDVEIWFFNNQSNNYVVFLDGANYVHFEHLKIRPAGSSRQIGVLLRQGASYNEFSNCWIIGTSTGYNSYKALVHGDGNGSTLTGNKFRQSRFENGGYQFWVGASSWDHAQDLEIVDNVFTGNAGRGIFLKYLDDCIIRNNLFEGTRFSSTTGIGLEYCGGNILIEKNKIEVTGSYNAVAFDNCTPSALIFRNNFVATTSTSIDIDLTSNAQIVNNSFHNISGNGYNIILKNNITNLDIYNNAMRNSGGNYCLYSYYDIDTNEIRMDFNSYYTTGSFMVKENNVDYNFTDWQTQTGLETNSYFVDPLFTTDTDLHILNATTLNQAGTPLASVNDDIDNELRNMLAPDIGADEFTIDSSNYYDLRLYAILQPDTLVCSAPDSLTISIINKSNFTMNSFDAKWSLYGVTQDSTTYNLSIPAGDTVNLTLAAFNFVPNTYYEFDFEVLLPNGNPDNYFNDNTLSIQYQHLNHARIGQRSRPDCSTDVELYITTSRRSNVLWSTGEFTNTIIPPGPGTYTVTVTDQYGCTVTDSIVVN